MTMSAAEGEKPPSSTDTVCPSFVYPCPQHANTLSPDEIDLCDEAGDRIKITVGQSPSAQIFQIHKRLLCHFSEYFKAALRGDCFSEAKSGEFALPDDDPEEFRRWVLWLYSCTACKTQPFFFRSHECDEKDRGCVAGQEADTALIFADRMLSQGYYLFALGHLIRHIHLAGVEHLGRLAGAEEEGGLRQDSAACRFLRDWLAWLKYQGYDKEHADEMGTYPDLFTSFDGWSSRDPRLFGIGHWYSPCSSVVNNTGCIHVYARPFYPPGWGKQETSGTPTRERTWRSRITTFFVCIWLSIPVTTAVLGALIYQRDKAGLISREAKIVGVFEAGMMGLGTYGFLLAALVLDTDTRMDQAIAIMMMLSSILSTFGGGIFSTYWAGECFKAAREMQPQHGDGICAMQTGLGAVSILYSISYWTWINLL